MLAENTFLITEISIFTSILLLFLFYFAALRRLFIPPTPSMAFVLAIALIGLPGFLLVFCWGWLQHRAKQITELMIAWTAALTLFVAEIILLAKFERTMPAGLSLAIQVAAVTAIVVLTVWKLIPFLRADDRMRTLMRDSTPNNLRRLSALGEQAIPHLQVMLDNEYLPYRLDAVECLALMGPAGIPLLQEISKRGDSEEAFAARSALAAVKTMSEAE